MSLKITDSHISTTKKRIDLVVIQSGLFVEKKSWKIRIVAGDQLPTRSGPLKELLERVIENQKHWKPGKKSQYLRMPDINATAYILKEATDGEDTTD